MAGFMGALVVLCLVAVATVPAFGKDYTVGDSQGWTSGVDYSTWASGKVFKVGDTLLFTYSGLHSTEEVSKSDYDSCSTSNALQTHTDGNTKISLTAPGSRYFICGTAGHCASGMKLAVTVAKAGSASPPTGSSPTTPTPSGGSSTSPPSTPNSPSPPGPAGGKSAADFSGFRGGDAVVLGGLIGLGLVVMG
ncbi:hypothetical protein KFK09_007628 [Dendrobium nobile]|uniref:Phytocyanin domain-containing protein n=1 Tax=Dendrobium nobile TaxID=94219 RepID=A0A8T3BX42_DENNO|nr:hypothetical protein KFK09_007628 [Dendrobium nobile]